jgi:hypothetical protein
MAGVLSSSPKEVKFILHYAPYIQHKAMKAAQHTDLPMFAGRVINYACALTVNVADALTGQPVAGVDAIINPGNIRTVTTDGGDFYIPSLASGNYILTLRRIGYASSNANITIAEIEGKPLDLMLAMMPLGI